MDVVYRVAGPGGTWNRADNGQYAVGLRAGEVADQLGAAAPAGALGTFVVKIPKGATPAAVVAPAAAVFSRMRIGDDGSDDVLW